MIKYIKISDRKKVFFWVMDNTGEIQYSFYNAEKFMCYINFNIKEIFDGK